MHGVQAKRTVRPRRNKLQRPQCVQGQGWMCRAGRSRTRLARARARARAGARARVGAGAGARATARARARAGLCLPSRPIVCLSAGRTKATLVEPVTPNTQNMTAASVRFSRQCGLCCSVQSQNCFNRDAGGGGGGGGGVPVHSNRPNGGRCGWTAVGRRLKAQTGRRASCIGLSSMHGCGSSSTPSGPSNTALDPSNMRCPSPSLSRETYQT